MIGFTRISSGLAGMTVETHFFASEDIILNENSFPYQIKKCNDFNGLLDELDLILVTLHKMEHKCLLKGLLKVIFDKAVCCQVDFKVKYTCTFLLCFMFWLERAGEGRSPIKFQLWTSSASDKLSLPNWVNSFRNQISIVLEGPARFARKLEIASNIPLMYLPWGHIRVLHSSNSCHFHRRMTPI